MGYLGTPPQSGFITTAKQRVTSSTNNYVDLDHSISSIADVIVFVNFVKQDTTNLTLTTSTRITLGATLVSSDIVEIHYLGKAVNTQTPATGTVTNDMLAGSIANSKLANSSITLNGSAVSLGGSATVGGSAGTESFFVTKSSSDDQTLSNNTATKITFDTEGVDAGNNFASNKYTVPSAGKYFFEAQVKGESNLDSKIATFTIYIYKNGSIILANDNELTAGYEKKITKNVSGVLDLAQNDYLEVYLIINWESSATLSAKGGSQGTTHFLGFKLA